MTKINYHSAKFIASYGVRNQLPLSENNEFVFCGRSNVGKSTLINKVFNRKTLARTSSTPGKTATINVYRCESLEQANSLEDGNSENTFQQKSHTVQSNIDFIDLPGYGYAKTSKNEQRRLAELLDGYFAKKRNILSVFLLVDSRRALSLKNEDNDDRIMFEFLKAKEIPFYVVFTKTDKLKKTELEQMICFLDEQFPSPKKILFSALKNTGIVDMQNVIAEAI
ncbi:putative GTP-binding protein EngB [Clostridia bacterium]|nr:putative GTP-binding protein EngB [Clostridia bacterium]